MDDQRGFKTNVPLGSPAKQFDGFVLPRGTSPPWWKILCLKRVAELSDTTTPPFLKVDSGKNSPIKAKNGAFALSRIIDGPRAKNGLKITLNECKGIK